MATMTIDRLTVRVTGAGADDARRLAQRIAEELAILPAPRRARLALLRVQVDGVEPGGTDELARRVATEVLRQVAQMG